MVQEMNCVNISDYDKLKNLARECEVPSFDLLEKLKGHFAANIKSSRRMEFIRSLPDLLAYLERCDVLSEEDLTAIVVVANVADNQPLRQAISLYVPLQTTSYEAGINLYSLHRLNTLDQLEVQRKSEKLSTENVARPVVTALSVLSIHKLIIQEIGSYWRQLGRELDISEATMDETEVQFPRDLKSRTARLLQLKQESSVDLEQHINSISQALVACQRKDLRRKLDALLAQ